MTPSTVPELLAARAAAHPERDAAVVPGAGSLTYGAWRSRSNALARGLRARGIEPGDRVALFFDNASWIDYAVSYVGVLAARAVAVPLSVRSAPRELEHMLGHSGARLVLARPGARDGGVDRRTVEAGMSGDPLDDPPAPDDPADILYTSGTTGLPKGVASRHVNVAYGEPPDPAWEGRTFVHAIPNATFAGTHAMLLLPMRAGMTNVVLPSFDPDAYCAAVERHRASFTYLVPAMGALIVSSGAHERHDLSSMRLVMFGAAPMPAGVLRRLAEAFGGARLLNLYGLTEAGQAVTRAVYDPSRPASVGKPAGATRVRIAGPSGAEQPAGEPGEVWLRLDGVRQREYYRDPDATARVFAGGWTRTGDIGYLDEDGYLYLVDRSKDLVIRGGLNVSTLEVEDVLHEHPSVAEAAVFGVPHDVLGEDVAVAVVVRGESVEEDELVAFCAARLADYKVPRHITVVDGLPRNALGKVLKRQLREEFAAFGSNPDRQDRSARGGR